MLDQELETRILSFGYQPIGRASYKLKSPISDEVEHYLEFVQYKVPGKSVIIEYGFRNPEAERFSYCCMKKYGPNWASRLHYSRKRSFSTVFDSRVLDEHWKNSPLGIPIIKDEKFYSSIIDHIEKSIIPVTNRICDLRSLFEALVGDERSARWSLTRNGAMRAAQVVSVGRQTGVSKDQIKSVLKERGRRIDAVLNSKRPDSFVNAVIEDCELRGHNT